MLSIRNRSTYTLKIYAIYLYYSARSLSKISIQMLRAISKEITVLYGILQCIDINESVVYRRREKKRIRCIMIDESMIKGEVYWLWVAYEPYINKYLLMDISKDRTTLRCYYFIKRLKRLYGNRYTIRTDVADHYLPSSM